MRKTGLLLCFLFFALFAFAQQRSINFEKGTFALAVAKAKAENKMMFLDAYTTWCGPCKMMSKEVFTLNNVADYANENFINVKVDMESNQGMVLAKKLDINAFPTLIVFDSEGNELKRYVGTFNGDEFINFLSSAPEASKEENGLASMHARYKKGERDATFISQYLILLKENYMFRTEKELRNQFENSFGVADFLNPDNAPLTETLLSPIENDNFKKLFNALETLSNEDRSKAVEFLYEAIKRDYQLINSKRVETGEMIQFTDKLLSYHQKMNLPREDDLVYHLAKAANLMYKNNVAESMEYMSENIFAKNLLQLFDIPSILLLGRICYYPIIHSEIDDCRVALKGIDKIIASSKEKEIKEYMKGYKTGFENKILYIIEDEKIEKEKTQNKQK